MQKPSTPIRPVQSSLPANKARVASMSPKALPSPDASARKVERRQRTAPPAEYRSGATAR